MFVTSTSARTVQLANTWTISRLCDGLISNNMRNSVELKAGIHMKAVFWLVIMVLTQISRLRFKQSRISMLISHIYVLGRSVNFLVIFSYIYNIAIC